MRSHKAASRSFSYFKNLGLETLNLGIHPAQILPKFRKQQTVFFNGGVGIIKNYCLDAGSWSYAVQMEMGPEPEMGRIGYETTILLNETEIEGVLKN